MLLTVKRATRVVKRKSHDAETFCLHSMSLNDSYSYYLHSL